MSRKTKGIFFLVIALGFTLVAALLGPGISRDSALAATPAVQLPAPVTWRPVQTEQTPAAIAVLEGETQTLTTPLESYAYPSIVVQKGVPVVWTIQAEATQLNGCNNEIVSRDLGFGARLSAGQTVIAFTPEATGVFTYTCWMGMISGTVEVVDDLGALPENYAIGATASIPAQTGCCCCGQ